MHHIAPLGRRERSIRSKMRRQAHVRIFTDKNSLDHFRHGQIDFATRLEREDLSSSRHRALAFWWSMIFFRKPAPTFRDHALEFDWYRAARDLRGR
jgi:hypothetical protein